MNIQNKNKLKKTLILFLFLFILIHENFFDLINNITLNESSPELKEIIEIIEKFLDPNTNFVLSEKEKIIAEYYKEHTATVKLCPFTVLTSHGLTRDEALLILDFFSITDIEDLKILKEFLENNKK
jgi:hypothetical protein